MLKYACFTRRYKLCEKFSNLLWLRSGIYIIQFVVKFVVENEVSISLFQSIVIIESIRLSELSK